MIKLTKVSTNDLARRLTFKTISSCLSGFDAARIRRLANVPTACARTIDNDIQPCLLRPRAKDRFRRRGA